MKRQENIQIPHIPKEMTLELHCISVRIPASSHVTCERPERDAQPQPASQRGWARVPRYLARSKSADHPALPTPKPQAPASTHGPSGRERRGMRKKEQKGKADRQEVGSNHELDGFFGYADSAPHPPLLPPSCPRPVGL